MGNIIICFQTLKFDSTYATRREGLQAMYGMPKIRFQSVKHIDFPTSSRHICKMTQGDSPKCRIFQEYDLLQYI